MNLLNLVINYKSNKINISRQVSDSYKGLWVNKCLMCMGFKIMMSLLSMVFQSLSIEADLARI